MGASFEVNPENTNQYLRNVLVIVKSKKLISFRQTLIHKPQRFELALDQSVWLDVQ